MKDNQKTMSLLANKVLIAEDTQDENDVFLTLELTLCSSEPNQNNEGVSKEFIADVVSRNDEFTGLPLYADVKRLTAKEFDKQTHLYNRFNRKFYTTQIGGMLNFRVDTEDDVDYLRATARIPKRETEICEAITEMYNEGLLCFSFEVKYLTDDTHIAEGGARIIDVGPHNALTGCAIVSVPACREAVALDLVAELKDGGELTATERGETMPNEQMTAEVVEEEIQVAEEAVAEDALVDEEDKDETEETVAEDAADENEVQDDKEDDEDKDNDDAVAEVVMHAVETEQVYHKGNPDWNEPDTVRTTVTETVVETVEDEENGEAVAESEAPVVVAEEDEKDRKIAELETRIAELEVIESKYNEIMKAEADKALAEKQAKAKAFAEKQGLNVTETAVAEAISALDYAKIAELTMALAQDEEPEADEEPVQKITLASFVELDVGDQNSYGGLLNRRNK